MGKTVRTTLEQQRVVVAPEKCSRFDRSEDKKIEKQHGRSRANQALKEAVFHDTLDDLAMPIRKHNLPKKR
jgi:hypothetical protein